MLSIDHYVRRHFAARDAIFKHVGYREDWRVLPLSDDREMWWSVDADERREVKFSPKREALEYWLAEHDDEYGPHGDVLYSNAIYTQRHLPKWVYRGPVLVMLVVDTQTDGNQWLMLVRADHEIKPEKR